MKIKYIPVSLRILNEGSRGKQQQYYVVKRSDNFDFSSVGDKLYSEVKSLGRRGSNKDFIKTYLNNSIKSFPLAKRFNTSVIELPQIPKSKISDIIYDAKNDRFLYLIQRYDGGGIEKGNKQNIYLSADSINFPIEARNVKKKYNINYFSNDTVIESESINNIKNTYCNKPIEVLSCIYDNDIDQYIILIKDLTNENEINLYLNKEDFDIISKYGCVSDEGGHELCLDVSKLNLNESNKILNESFKDPFLKKLIDNSYNDIKFNSFTDKSLKNKIERSNLLPMVDWANLTEMDYTIVKSNISLLDDKTFNESAYKIFCSYDDNNNPYIVGINIKDIIWYTKYPIYYMTYTNIKRQEHDVKQNEVKLLNNSDFVILFNNDVLRNKKWNDRLMAKQKMNINPNSVKYDNLIRYRENILKNRLKNGNLHNNLTNTEKTFDIDKYIDSEFPIDYSKFGIPKWFKNKKINESFNDSFIKELIDNSFKSSYGPSYSIPIKSKLKSIFVSFDWANISNNDYIEVSPNEAKNNYPTDFKFYCKYDDEHKPYIIGIVNPYKHTVYDIYSIKNSKGSVVKNHSELYISRDADFALVFDSKLSDDYRNKRKTRIESRENALALMDPEEIKSNNINRYLSIITNKKYNNDILDDYIKNTLSIGNKKIEDLFDEYLKLNKSDDSDKNFIFHLYNKIKELNGYISGLLSTYEKYIDTKNLIKSMKGSSYDVEQIKQYKDNIIRYIDNIKDI